ncbi:MAG: ATP-binding cassette domain-containing protein [Siphonobacter aquaeclarae]|nr:ATP-binding cassette domain-containing protein [Siphonobacter aquaeclarae]
MIQTRDLTFAYHPDKQFRFPDIHCPDRDTLLILGRSGRGKTTFLHLLALLLQPQSGEITVADQAIAGLSAAEAARFRAGHIGLIYQRPHFVHSLSVLDNLLMANYLGGRRQEPAKARQLAESLGFQEHLHKKTHQLSLGEQQRVGIARALMNEPKVILADEPTSSLDDENCHQVVELLKQRSGELGASLVVVTHDGRLKEEFQRRVEL